VIDDRLVIRHRQPVKKPYPNPNSHPVPTFTFTPKTGQITVNFAVDPYFHSNDPLIPALSAVHTLPGDEYILTALPRRRPAGLVENLGSMFSSFGRSKSTPDAVFDGAIDLREGEVVEGDMEEAFEVDDDPDPVRELRVVCVGPHSAVGKESAYRRRWEVVPLRGKKAMTGAM
jgi:hypothetical protein